MYLLKGLDLEQYDGHLFDTFFTFMNQAIVYSKCISVPHVNFYYLCLKCDCLWMKCSNECVC